MALITHRRGRCQAVMGLSPFHTCMNPSCGAADVEGETVKLCRVHLKKHEGGKVVRYTDGTYTEGERGQVVWHTGQTR